MGSFPFCAYSMPPPAWWCSVCSLVWYTCPHAIRWPSLRSSPKAQQSGTSRLMDQAPAAGQVCSTISPTKRMFASKNVVRYRPMICLHSLQNRRCSRGEWKYIQATSNLYGTGCRHFRLAKEHLRLRTPSWVIIRAAGWVRAYNDSPPEYTEPGSNHIWSCQASGMMFPARSASCSIASDPHCGGCSMEIDRRAWTAPLARCIKGHWSHNSVRGVMFMVPWQRILAGSSTHATFKRRHHQPSSMQRQAWSGKNRTMDCTQLISDSSAPYHPYPFKSVKLLETDHRSVGAILMIWSIRIRFQDKVPYRHLILLPLSLGIKRL